MRAIDRLLLTNGELLERLDKSVNYLTIIAPGQTPLIELAGESIVSLTAILQLYRNQVIAGLTEQSQKSLESRYLSAQYKESRAYQVLAYILGITKSTEILVEMGASQYGGKRGKWNAVIGIESLKAATRLAMLVIAKRVMPSSVPLHNTGLDNEEVIQLLSCRGEKFKDMKGGLKPVNIDKLRPPLQLLRPLTTQLAVSEILAILRPLLYALLLKKYRKHPKSWTPWLIGAFLEFSARELGRGSIRKPTGLEKEVYGNRGSDMLWWLVRGAAFENYTKPLITGVTDKLSKVPVLNLATKVIEDGCSYFEELYFATATL